MKSLLSYLPLVVLTVMMMYSCYVVSTTYYVFSYEHYIGLVGLSLSWLALIFNRVISKLLTLAILVIGSFAQAAFTVTITRSRIGGSLNGHGMDILLQPICILLLVIFIFLNWRLLQRVFKEWSINVAEK